MTASILIVDDQLELLAFTGAFLAECGYTVSWAQNAAVALQLLESNNPVDILLTDIVMPGGMDGFELARRAKGIRPDLKVVYCTGHRELSPEQIGQTYGPLLKKPYQYSRLAAVLEFLKDQEVPVAAMAS
jgi:CheY-like chemotaxis protein